MSHELEYNSRGRIEAAFRVTPAWHGLGAVLTEDQAADFDGFKRAAGFDWRIQRSVVRYATERGQDAAAMATWDDQHVLMRSDDKRPLGLVSKGYKVVQPGEIFEFFRAFCAERGWVMESAGILQGGRRFWAMARMGDGFTIGQRDKHAPYCLLSSSADGSLATEGRVTIVRVVCANTLAAARDSKAEYRLTHRSQFSEQAAAKALGLVSNEIAEYQRDAETLAGMAVSSQQAAVIIAGLLNPSAVNFKTGAVDADAFDATMQSKRSGFDRVMGLFSGAGHGAMLDSARGTGFGILQAFTEFYDHHCNARSDENRFLSAQYGAHANAKREARDVLLSIARGSQGVTA